jgi:uncharacterized protein (DUF2141 family)
MKKITIYSIVAAFTLGAMVSHVFAQGNLEVTVQNIKEKKGTIRVGLFTNEKDFLKKATEGKVVKASGEEIIVSFNNLKPGIYAVSVIHDENENGELDSNFMGIPKEGFGFGNNAMGSFGPPSFDEAKVIIDKDPVKQVVKLKYY